MTSISQDDQQLDQRNISAIDRILESPSRWDQLMAKWSDRISPILVRETRQQLKSRQFVITFWAVLVFILIWTIYGIAENMPAIYYESTGPFMMAGYFVLFLLPTCISVPLAAYQSMAAEMDEGTGDVLAISTLTPWQIVAGKLLAAMLQTFLYLATLTPCIVLTYRNFPGQHQSPGPAPGCLHAGPHADLHSSDAHLDGLGNGFPERRAIFFCG